MSIAESNRKKLYFDQARKFGLASMRKPDELSKTELQRMLAEAAKNTAQQQALSEDR